MVLYAGKKLKSLSLEAKHIRRASRTWSRICNNSCLRIYCRRLEVRLHGLPVLAVCWLHGFQRLHFQPFHPLPRPVLVHHFAPQVPQTEDQEESPNHDCTSLDQRPHVDRSHPRLEVLCLRWQASVARSEFYASHLSKGFKWPLTKWKWSNFPRVLRPVMWGDLFCCKCC